VRALRWQSPVGSSVAGVRASCFLNCELLTSKGEKMWKPSNKGEKTLQASSLFNSLVGKKKVLIKESMVKVEFRVNSKCRSWIGYWRKSKSKDHLCPYPSFGGLQNRRCKKGGNKG
jgi:hypothetical protein